MTLQTKIFLLLLLTLILLGLGAAFKNGGGLKSQRVVEPDVSAVFACTGGRFIEAGFSDDLAQLKLSDGRSYTLEHALSASGVRFANDDESIVFWNKGETAFFEEAGVTTYADCFEVKTEGREPTDTVVTGTVATSSPARLTLQNGAGERDLIFDPLSICAAPNGAVACQAMSSPFEISFGGKLVSVEGNATDGGVIVRKLLVLEEGSPLPSFSGTGSVFISWPEALFYFRRCEVETAMQTHALDINMHLKDGRDVRAVEPVIDEVFRVLDETREACGTIPIATE